MSEDLRNPRQYFGAHPMLGPAYHQIFKAMATALMMAIVLYAYRALEQGGGAVLGTQTRMLFAMVGLTVLFTYYGLLRSQTTIDGEGIAQSWMFKTGVAWEDIRAVRVQRHRLAVRLMVRTQAGRVHVYDAGSDELGFAFDAIARAYPSA